MPPQPLLPRRRQPEWPDPLSAPPPGQAGPAHGGPRAAHGQPEAGRLIAVGAAVWQCTLCLALFSSFYAAKMHLIKTKRPGAAGAAATGTGRGAAAASESPTPSCFQSAVNIAKQKNRETGPGQIFSPADVAGVRHSLSGDSQSLPRSRRFGRRDFK